MLWSMPILKQWFGQLGKPSADLITDAFSCHIGEKIPGLVQNCPTPYVIELANIVANDAAFFDKVSG